MILKESFAGLLSLLMEAAKCDGDLDGIRWSVTMVIVMSLYYSGILEDHKMSHDRVQIFTEAYKVQYCHLIVCHLRNDVYIVVYVFACV